MTCGLHRAALLEGLLDETRHRIEKNGLLLHFSVAQKGAYGLDRLFIGMAFAVLVQQEGEEQAHCLSCLAIGVGLPLGQSARVQHELEGDQPVLRAVIGGLGAEQLFFDHVHDLGVLVLDEGPVDHRDKGGEAVG